VVNDDSFFFLFFFLLAFMTRPFKDCKEVALMRMGFARSHVGAIQSPSFMHDESQSPLVWYCKTAKESR
jgi:hypothetical protein